MKKTTPKKFVKVTVHSKSASGAPKATNGSNMNC